MTAKHKPATSLPWECDAVPGDASGVVVGPTINDDCRVICDISKHGKRILGSKNSSILNENDALDAAYIVHAANAYPRLVEALRNLKEQVECMNAQQAFGRDYDEARALLRELGEAD